VKDYHDKINKLAERIVSGREQFGRENIPGWREALTTAQVGAEIISAERGGISAAISICSVEDRSIRRPIEGDTTTFANDKYYVKDVHYGNVIEQKGGKLVIIDANATYNEGYKRELFNNSEFFILEK
jgi:hypothetical protein